MSTIADRLKNVEDCGFENVAHFILPQSAWWNDYYTPIERRLSELREKYRTDAAALTEIGEAQKEIDLYRLYSDFYGYVFFIARKTSR